MANEAVDADDALHSPATLAELRSQNETGMNTVVLQRLIEDDRRLRELLSKHLDEAMEKERNADAPRNTLLEEVSTKIITQVKQDNPQAVRNAEIEANSAEIGDLLSLMTPSDDPMWDDYSEEEKEAVRKLRDDPDTQEALRHQRYAEEMLGRPDDMPPLQERIKGWVESGHAKKAATHARHAVVAGMMLASPPMAAGMVASMAMRKVVAPQAAKIGLKLKDKAEEVLLDRGAITQEQLDASKERLDNATKAVTNSKWGSFGLALGGLALSGVGVSLGMDALSGDDLGTRMQTLWSSTKDLATELPGFGSEVAEADMVEPANAGADAPDATEPEADASEEPAPQAQEGSEVTPEAGEDTPAAEASVTHDIVTGDTLSESVYDAYQDQGIELSAEELYGPSEHTDHPGGIVGMVAEENGFADPDLIYPGDTISMEISNPDLSATPSPETASPSPEADPVMSQAAVEAAEQVAPGPELSDEAVDAAVTTAEQADQAAPEGHKRWHDWALGAAGALGVVGAVQAVKRMLSDEKPEAVAEAESTGSHKPDVQAEGPVVEEITKAEPEESPATEGIEQKDGQNGGSDPKQLGKEEQPARGGSKVIELATAFESSANTPNAEDVTSPREAPAEQGQEPVKKEAPEAEKTEQERDDVGWVTESGMAGPK